MHIFPCMLHAAPARFGAADAQAGLGFQMAGAYTALTLLPPAFGWLASSASPVSLPAFLEGCLALVLFGTEALRRLPVNPPSPSV